MLSIVGFEPWMSLLISVVEFDYVFPLGLDALLVGAINLPFILYTANLILVQGCGHNCAKGCCKWSWLHREGRF